MALNTSQQVSLHDLVVEASALAYELQGYEVLRRHQPHPRRFGREPFDLLVPAIPRVEEVETAATLAAVDRRRLARCREAGLQVRLLVPLREIAAAHSLVRGCADHLVPFWLTEDAVRFGPPRLP
jgi:hypothetical protein